MPEASTQSQTSTLTQKPSEKRPLALKLVEVMACVDRVAKNGTNASQGYKYAQAADVYAEVRGELAKRFVLPVPRIESIEWGEVPTRAGGVLKLCTVRGHIDFTDAESGEVMSVLCFGQGSDSGDKAGYKAITGATKQCLVQLFLIPTGDDPENEPKQSTVPRPSGVDGLKTKAASAGAKPADIWLRLQKILTAVGMPEAMHREFTKSVTKKTGPAELVEADVAAVHDAAQAWKKSQPNGTPAPRKLSPIVDVPSEPGSAG